MFKRNVNKFRFSTNFLFVRNKNFITLVCQENEIEATLRRLLLLQEILPKTAEHIRLRERLKYIERRKSYVKTKRRHQMMGIDSEDQYGQL